MLQRLLDNVLYTRGSWELTLGEVTGVAFLLFVAFLCYRLTKAAWRLEFYRRFSIEPAERRRFEVLLRQLILIVFIILSVQVLDLDPIFYQTGNFVLRFSLFLIVLAVMVGAKILDWTLSNVISHSYNKGHAEINAPSNKQLLNKATKTIRYIVFVIAGILLLRNFDLDFSLYNYTSDGVEVDFRLSKILTVVLIILAARLITWFVSNILLFSTYRSNNIDQGSQFAINQILKYIIYTIAILMALNSLNINMTLILGGAAALLVGVGLGLQQTFNDFFSGLVLLFERSVSVGDILTVNNIQGTVMKIGLRSSVLETLGNQNIIIPNSKLVNDNVLNWNHDDDMVRFDVSVGVAYGTDTELVHQLLIKAALGHEQIYSHPAPFVRFQNFGNSSLDFTLFFFTKQLVTTDDIKSDLRFAIDKLFREHDITIPFPQTDVWIHKQG